jgi:endonuclease/exonuclease/phosphatase family metal-dependent hydrolase
MDRPVRILFRLRTLADLVLPALTIAMGLQSLRVFFPSLVWYLQDAAGAGSITLALYAFGAFLAAFLAAALRRFAGPRFALWIPCAGIALLRTVEQIVRNPALDLWIALVGAALFVLFLPIWVGHLRARDESEAAPRFAYGLVLGLALDTAVKGAGVTLDLSWHTGVIPLAVVLIMSAATLWALAREQSPAPEAPSEADWGSSLPLIMVGPYLMLQALVFQNQGWASEVSGIGMGEGFDLVMLGNLGAVIALIWCFARGHPYRLALSLIGASYLVLVVIGADRPGIAFAYALVLAQVVMGWGIAWLSATALKPARAGLGRTTLSVGLGLILFLLLSFIYYVSLNMALPIPRQAMMPAAGGIVGLGMVFIALRGRSAVFPSWRDKTGLFVALALSLVAVLTWMTLGPAPASELPAGLPIRALTYNIHSAFNSDGVQDPEAIARVIEASGADIVALQEVSRGWLIDGSTDLPEWLSRRLGMPFLFQGTTDPMWGNAILSRYPAIAQGWGRLPLAGTLLARGYLWAEIEVGAAEPLLVIATHLHHVESEHEPRLQQVPVLLEFWDGRPHTLLMGDLNSEPDYPEMGLIRDAGLVDSWTEAGTGNGHSWPAREPFERIDWVWHSPDLVALDAVTLPGTASDHLGVLVTIDAAP